MFFAHWAATDPRETVVSAVRSESGSAERRSMTRQKRYTARSAVRSFTTSPDGLGEAVPLGATGEATGVGKEGGWGLRLLQPARQTTTTAVKTHATNKPSRVCTTHLPSIPSPLRTCADPGGQKARGCLDDANPRRARTVLAWRPVHNRRSWLTSCQQKAPRAQPVPVGADPSSTTSMLHVEASTT
jgi:hypothetical protein